MRRIGMLLVTVLLSGNALAQEARSSGSSTLLTGEYLMQVFASLALVIGLMVAMLWLLRRFNGVGHKLGAGSPLTVVASVGLGQRERAVLIGAGDKQILIGVAPGHISALHVFDEPVTAPIAESANEKSALKFAEVWRQATGGQEKSS
ncbi:MAG: flagellar biosynthetic protein FliO [Halieaceae bacterium]|jgi:flagellar protein FliO/FliZ|nr:flagellar biosynthetic protein FliO [Halieaceae bacterium]